MEYVERTVDMDINTKAFQDAVMDGNFATFNQDITPQALKKSGIAQALQPVFAAVDDAISAGKLIQAQLTITETEPTIVRLETGIINLPFADAKKIINFLEPEEMVPLRLYLIVVSPHVNASGLRIDQIATLADYQQAKAAPQQAIIAATEEKLATIATNALAPKPEPGAAKPAAKKPARKAAAKKPARKPAAKKTTTRKPAAKKTAARKPAAK
ncbi:hypothetical protein ACFQ5J_04030 [Lacticaseibacillus baoqingensis]|uniref:Uncharacterized protein n=1 Tax=Lacticaseibacillus baoqingensis TaxID=2486013 RepID=A0ABW4E3E3_9LACO|nr:hypothetical protein [Lacticaseibacillus baoqingensis]